MQPEYLDPTRKVRILIADDHPVVRDGLRRLLEEESDFRVVGAARDGEEALARTKELQPDVLLLDLLMPRADGLQVLRRLQNLRSKVCTIMLAGSIDKQQVREALELGARGVIMKSAGVAVFIKGIRRVLAGELWVDRATLADLVQFQPAQNRRFGLTERELQMVAEIAAGAANKEIANKFHISDKTVKRHLANIFEKVGVTSRLELAVFALNHGLVQKQ
jgi:two-component system nitrate/nitrite response regulator NarL